MSTSISDFSLRDPINRHTKFHLKSDMVRFKISIFGNLKLNEPIVTTWIKCSAIPTLSVTTYSTYSQKLTCRGIKLAPNRKSNYNKNKCCHCQITTRAKNHNKLH